MTNITTNDILKIALGLAVIIVVVVYPVLKIPVDQNIMSAFGAIITMLLGVSINNGASKNE